MNKKISSIYDNKFYNIQKKQNMESAEIIVPIILNLVSNKDEPISVIDIGCGSGNWLSVYKKYGCEVMGIDGGNVLKEVMMISSDEFKMLDLNNGFRLRKKYDIATCLEVAEHLSLERADSFVKDLLNLSDVIIFSAAIPHQRGANHINEQYPTYWIEKFNGGGVQSS